MKRRAPSRRKHQNSRLGCSECKRRHIRCDESRPSCLNCRLAKIVCPFLTGDQSFTSHGPSTVPSPSTEETNRRTATLEPHVSLPDLFPVVSPAATPLDDSTAFSPDYNVVHIRLYPQFLTESCLPMLPKLEQLDIYRKTVVKFSFIHPFLMSEILAFAALHLSITTPDEQEKPQYKYLSAGLMNRAVTEFNESLPMLDADNCVAFVLFTHMVALHSFCSTMQSPKASIGSFLPPLTHTISLMRGVDSIMQPWFPVLLETELGSFIRDASGRPTASSNVGGLTDQFSQLLRETDMGETTRDVYTSAMHALQHRLNLEPPGEAATPSTFGVFAWFIAMPRELNVYLEERRPEALVLLAWYAVILHRHRGSWIIRDAGQYLFKLIEEHLGSRWEPLLSWPKKQLSTDN